MIFLSVLGLQNDVLLQRYGSLEVCQPYELFAEQKIGAPAKIDPVGVSVVDTGTPALAVSPGSAGNQSIKFENIFNDSGQRNRLKVMAATPR